MTMKITDLEYLEPLYVQDKISETVSDIYRYNDKWQFRCPVCGDSKKRKKMRRGFYYVNTNSYHCFNDGCTGHSTGLWIVAKFLNMPIGDVRKDFIEYASKYDRPYAERIEVDVKPAEKRQVFQIPDNWLLPPDNVKKYLEDRMIYRAPYLPSNYQFYYNVSNRRLVISWVEKGEIRYYQERAMTSRQIPKYLFPKNTSRHVYGLDRLDDNGRYMYLMEGFLDCIYVYNGVCVGSISMTELQKDVLAGYAQEKVLMFDNQWADKTSYDMSCRLAKEHPEMKMFIWPSDIAEKDVNEYFVNHYPQNPFNDPVFLESRIMSGLRVLIELKKHSF